MITKTDTSSKSETQHGFIKPSSLGYVVLGSLFMCGAAVALAGPSFGPDSTSEESISKHQRAAQERKLELDALMTRLPAHERIQELNCSPMPARHSLECTYTSFGYALEKHDFTVAVPVGQPLEKITYKAMNHNEFELTFSPALPHEKRITLLKSFSVKPVE